MNAGTIALFLAVGAVSAQPPITLLEPNGGQVYHVGDTMRIRWTADNSVPLVCIEICVDGGESGWWYGTHGRGIGWGGIGWGDTTWVITDTLSEATTKVSTISNLCLVRIRSYVGQVTEDRSDSVFAIVAPQGVQGRSRLRRSGAIVLAQEDGVLTVRGAGVIDIFAADLRGRVAVQSLWQSSRRLAPGVWLASVAESNGPVRMVRVPLFR